MKTTAAAVTLILLAAAAASAQDVAPPTKSPAPVPDATKAPPAAKKERKADAAAEAAIKKYAGLLHFPSPRFKTLEMNCSADMPTLGGEVGCRFRLDEKRAIAIDIKLSEAAEAQYGAQLATLKQQVAGMVRGMFKPFLVPVDDMVRQYDMASRVENGHTLVEMTRFADDAGWDTLKLDFDADGILAKQVGTPHIDPNDMSDPMAAMNAGADVETALVHKKRGDRWTIESVVITAPSGETSAKLAYFEIQGVGALPKEIAITNLMGEMVVNVHDFVIDGKPVAGTERKVEEKKPAPPPPPAPKKDPAPAVPPPPK